MTNTGAVAGFSSCGLMMSGHLGEATLEMGYTPAQESVYTQALEKPFLGCQVLVFLNSKFYW